MPAHRVKHYNGSRGTDTENGFRGLSRPRRSHLSPAITGRHRRASPFQSASSLRDRRHGALICLLRRKGALDGVGLTHIHPSWRTFATLPLTPVPPDRYEITFTDVPVGMRVTFRINDQNSCDENPTGAVTRNVFANDVRLAQNATTPRQRR